MGIRANGELGLPCSRNWNGTFREKWETVKRESRMGISCVPSSFTFINHYYYLRGVAKALIRPFVLCFLLWETKKCSVSEPNKNITILSASMQRIVFEV